MTSTAFIRFPRALALGIVLALSAAGCVAPRPITPEPQGGRPGQPPPTADPSVQTQPAIPPEAPAPETVPPPSRPRTLKPASRVLVAQAQTQANAGNDAMAAVTLERALRIEPDNPLLWIELAKIRHNEGNESQAENLARKALSMATGDGKTQAAAWRVIANSYRARGRNPEAREAETKAANLGG
ncbi:MAG TPA: tetratricopeptide repeat protein [Steroidobacteraceae bacterium]|nr:tetratricopeptide repeat protein [Steroidobacteraceae bacterium]